MSNILKNHLAETRPHIIYCGLVLVFGILAGILLYPLFEAQMERLLEEAFGGVLVEGDDTATIINVFLRNVSATIIMLMSGIFILPVVIILFLNGMLVGLVSRYVNNQGISILKIIYVILPHGIFEIPALLISAGLGVKIGVSIIFPRGEKRILAASKNIQKGSIVYLLVIIPLLAIAAIIEILVSKNMV